VKVFAKGDIMLTPTGTEMRNQISQEIELVREEMIRLGTHFGFLHPEVQRCSKRLDQLLLLFYDLERKKAAALEAESL
jgi:hypothetical protein